MQIKQHDATEKCWVIVADAAHARIFETVGRGRRLHEIHDLNHPESQMYAHQLRTGGSGAVADSAGHGRRQPDPQVNTSEKHSAHFAKELSTFLHRERNKNAFERLILVAEPKLLGRLRDGLDRPTTQRVTDSIDKNWVKQDVRQIEELLKDTL